MVSHGAVLAGGRSTRMGSDKALVTVDGIPLALKTALVLQQAGCGTVSLVGRQPELTTLGLPVIRETVAQFHPLFGVAAALAQCPEPHMIIVPCDITNLSTEHVQALVDHGGPCVAFSNHRTHPLFGIFSRDMAEQAHELAVTNAPAHVLAQSLPSVQLPPPFLQDANYPDDING